MQDLLKAFDDAKQHELKTIDENHNKELQILRDSKTNEVLRLNKVHADLVKSNNAQTIRLKMEFSMKEAVLKNKIKRMEEHQEKKLLELTEMHDTQIKEYHDKLEELNCNHAKTLKETLGLT